MEQQKRTRAGYCLAIAVIVPKQDERHHEDDERGIEARDVGDERSEWDGIEQEGDEGEADKAGAPPRQGCIL